MTHLTPILRGDPAEIPAAIRGETQGYALTSCLTIVVGCALYGFTIGLWRAPEQAAYLAVKFPVLVFATILFNGLLNGMLAQVLGTGLGFRQTVLAILMSFATFAAILGALSPIAFFMAINAPPPDPEDMGSYRGFVLVHTAVIAYAGLVANLQMFGTLTQVSNRQAAIRTCIAWTSGNLFVGAQLAWNLRPFFGSPWGEIQFLRADAFEGSLYESVVTMFAGQLFRHGGAGIILVALAATALLALVCLFASALSKYSHINKTRRP